MLALMFAGTWVFGDYSDTACVSAYQNLPEGSAFHEEASLWPPGGDCVYELPDGSVETRAGPVPWAEWGLLGLMAGLAWLASALWHRLRGRVKSPPPESNRQPLHYK